MAQPEKSSMGLANERKLDCSALSVQSVAVSEVDKLAKDRTANKAMTDGT